jgi:multiple sugar transport system permease protein
MIAALASILSLAVTVTSGFMLSRLRGKPASTWFGKNFEL